MNLKFLHTKNLNILAQLKIEETIIRTDNCPWCIINEGSPPSIIMGISNTPEKLLNISLIKKNNIPVIKRFSGGGTVVVDNDSIFVTFIFPKKIIPFSYPEEIFNWNVNFYKKVFPLPDFSLTENDYTISNRKCGGNAQYIKKDKWLHHTCFLWDFNKKNMQFLQIPSKAPTYRCNRNHQDFLCCIKNHFPSKQIFISKIIEKLEENYSLEQISLENTIKYMESDHRKTTKLLAL